jgi:hypothetical protein
MAERKLLIETMTVPPDQWQKEWVTSEGLKESVLMPRWEEFNRLLEQEKNEQLIEHWRGSKDQILQELLSHNKRLRVTGPGQVENLKNQNGRIYPSTLWDRVLSEDGTFRRRLRERSVLGELEHPESGNTKLHGHNNLGLSHLVEDVQRKDGKIYVTHLIFNTPAGQILREYFDVGVPVAVSSRGSGSTRNENGDEIVEASDYVLDTFDHVYIPSVMGATTRPVESLQTNNGSRIFLVPILENKTMTTPVQLKESSDRTARARVVVESSGQYLGGKDITLEGLLEHAQKVNDTLAGLGSITESEFSSDVAHLRGQLTNRGEEITRAIRRMREAEECIAAEEKAKKEKEKKEDITPTDDAAARVMERAYRRDRSLQERYHVAIQLGETLVTKSRANKRMAERTIKQLRGQLAEAFKRAEASLKLLEATVKRYRGEQVAQYVESLMNHAPALKPIEKQLSECHTVKQVKQLVEGFIQPIMSGRKDYPSDLPPLTEARGSSARPARAGVAKPTNLMESLVRKVK